MIISGGVIEMEKQMSLAIKLREEMDGIRADLKNPEITDEERDTLQNIIDMMEDALMPLAQFSDDSTNPQ